MAAGVRAPGVNQTSKGAIAFTQCILDQRNGVWMLVQAGAPTYGAAGDGATFAGPGSLLIDITGTKIFINTNTLASPTWTAVGAQTA